MKRSTYLVLLLIALFHCFNSLGMNGPYHLKSKILVVSERFVDADQNQQVTIRGTVTDSNTGEGIPYASVGIPELQIGTVSDENGLFEFSISEDPSSYRLFCSHLSYEEKWVDLSNSSELGIKLIPKVEQLNEILIGAEAREFKKIDRLGWVNGKDALVSFDTLQTGGGVAAVLLRPKQQPFLVEGVQVRLAYNSKKDLKFRLHLYAVDTDSLLPSYELLTRDIILSQTKTFGWIRFDLSEYELVIDQPMVYLGIEWIDDLEDRTQLFKDLEEYQLWKQEEYEKGNSKISKELLPDGRTVYQYKGNMMNWPGFHELPPWAALKFQKGVKDKTASFKTVRKANAFAPWDEVDGTLNVVLVVKY